MARSRRARFARDAARRRAASRAVEWRRAVDDAIDGS